MEHELLWWSRMAAPLVVIAIASAAIIVLWLRYSPPLWWVMWRVRRARAEEVELAYENQHPYYQLGNLLADEHWFEGAMIWTLRIAGTRRRWQYRVWGLGGVSGPEKVKRAYDKLEGLYRDCREIEARQQAFEARFRFNA